MSRKHPVDISPSILDLLKLMWGWHWHNPVNLFEYRETPHGGRLIHPASRSSASVSGDGIGALLDRGWIRGHRELVLTNAGVAACRQVSESSAGQAGRRAGHDRAQRPSLRRRHQ